MTVRIRLEELFRVHGDPGIIEIAENAAVKVRKSCPVEVTAAAVNNCEGGSPKKWQNFGK